jgi:hypothetical protein
MQQQIINSIIQVINKNTNEMIIINNIECKIFTNKYSAKKASIWCLFINNNQIKKKDNLIFCYKCIFCEAQHSIGTTQFLRKINRNVARCYLCRNHDETKRLIQSKLMTDNNINQDIFIKKQEENLNLNDYHNIRNQSIVDFNNEDDDFKDNYFSSHLTQDEYQRIIKNLKSLGNDKYSDLVNYEYWPIYKSNNQMLFTHMFYDKKNNIIFKDHQPIIKCDNCNTYWRAKDLKKFKNNIKIFCKDCSLTNKTFKIRRTNNINNDIVLYQSKLELKFITWCNNNNILVLNGPKVNYNFNDVNRIYRVDFKINNDLIEIKDNHIWHQNDVKSGKFNEKKKAVDNLIKNKVYNNFYFITPSNWSNILKKLIKYSLTSYESMRSDSLNTLT